MTGMAKKERKNTASPGGTPAEAAALMQVAMAMNIATDRIFRPIPVNGFTDAPLFRLNRH